MTADQNLRVVPRNEANRFAHVDAMRAGAVLIVVIAHAGLGHIVPGGSGVTAFFTISGFIITFLALREFDKEKSFGLRGFYARRFLKIGPPLLVVIVVPSLIYAISRTFDWVAFSAQIFFLYNWEKVQGIPDVLPGSGVVWSLSVEEQFYIAFAAFWALAVRSPNRIKILITLSITTILLSNAARVLYAMEGGNSARIYYGTDTRIDGIAIGTLVATYIWAATRPANRADGVSDHWGRPVVLVAAFGLFILSLVIRDQVFRDTVRFLMQSVASGMVILYGMSRGSGQLRRVFQLIVNNKTVNKIGLASYSIYLAHLPILIALEPLLSDLPRAAAIPLRVAIALLAGWVLYRMVEVPVLRWRQARKRATHTSGSDGRES